MFTTVASLSLLSLPALTALALILVCILCVAGRGPLKKGDARQHTIRTVGILGNGVLGGTHARFAERAGLHVLTWDKLPDRSRAHSIGELLDCQLILVTVNTPMSKDGSCDTRAVESVCAQLAAAARERAARPIVVIKSTVPPGTTRRLAQAHAELRMAFSPERLRERSAAEDFEREGFVIVAGDPDAITVTETFYRQLLPTVEIRRTELELAETVKYCWNSFLAVCVSLANELRMGCEALGLSYAELVDLMRLDPRLTACPLDSPGPDGHYGFGGSCLPKDLRAMCHLFEQLGVGFHLGAAAWHVNQRCRNESAGNQGFGPAHAHGC